ncbi:pyrin and HIN domain-containing protein 1-like, partial [Tupaia chinensis]|uniref:pyrin and HIN domain-containing protein 1-like n=1 Tax=Tupaia chinensis TaxID=246437 RepID=UPI0003C914DB
MANEYKKIVLLKGLEHINNYYFSIIKSLLAYDLKLTRKMQHEYNRIQIADLMEKVFRYDAGVDKLIALIKNITPLKHLVKKLRAEKLKVVKKMKSISAKGKTPLERIQQTEVGPASPASTLSSSRTSEGVEGAPVAQKRKMTTTEKTGNKRNKVSEEQTSPLYAATTSKFTTMDHCPPSQTLSSTPSNNSSTTTIKCITTPIYDFKRMNPSKEQCQPPQTAAIRERPSKFYPQSSQASLQTPPSHSLRETGTRLTPRYGLERPIPSQEQGQSLRTAATPARPSEFHPQTSLVPPQTSPSRFLSQTGIRTTSIYDVERLNPPREQNPAPQTAATPARPSESHLHTPRVPSQTPLSPFLSQNIKDAIQTYNYKRMKSPWQLNQLLQTSDKRTPPTVSHSQIPPMPPQTPPHSSLNK